MRVHSFVDLLDLVAAEGNDLNGPVPVLDVVDLGGHRGDDAEVVARTLYGPPELGAGVQSDKRAVGKHNVHRLELVCNKPVAALQPAVATTQGGSEVADTFACTSN